jgi:hypothetical protein
VTGGILVAVVRAGDTFVNFLLALAILPGVSVVTLALSILARGIGHAFNTVTWVFMDTVVGVWNWNVVGETFTCVPVAGSYTLAVCPTGVTRAGIDITVLSTNTFHHGVSINTSAGVTLALVGTRRVLATGNGTAICTWIVIASQNAFAAVVSGHLVVSVDTGAGMSITLITACRVFWAG